jgi:predicted amidohydrolase
MDALALIREQIAICEAAGVAIVCCPEGILGGLADYAPDPMTIAIDVDGGQLDEVLAPLASDTVATIVGFTEVDRRRRLYNCAAVYHRGAVAGVYRKLHPAINRSGYDAGTAMPVFTVDDLTFGIVICYDSTFAEPVRVMASRGAAAVFVPTNNGLPVRKGGAAAAAAAARACDVGHAAAHGIAVVRADVAGHAAGFVSYGSTEIVGSDGVVLASAAELTSQLVVADIHTRRDARTEGAGVQTTHDQKNDEPAGRRP